jgi:hypothetical protein
MTELRSEILKAIPGIIEAAFPGTMAPMVEVRMEQRMGFSGASVAELALRWEKEGHCTDYEDDELPSAVFLKHIVVTDPGADMEPDTAAKVHRNIQSYHNEFAVMSSLYPLMDASTPPIAHPTVFYRHADQTLADGSSSSGTHTFTVMSESMLHSGWTQAAVLTAAQMEASITWMARFHALSFGKVATLGTGLWDQGTHLALDKRPGSELGMLSGIWKAFVSAFVEEHPVFSADPATLAEAGADLAALAPAVAVYLDPLTEANENRTCIVHGDFKPANLFVRETGSTACTSAKVCVCAIDYQWTGPGIAATDLVYLVAMAIPALSEMRLDEVLRSYWTHFTEARKQTCLDAAAPPTSAASAASDDDWAHFLLDFKVATLDFARWAFCARLADDSPAKFAARREKMDINLGAWRRDVNVIAWLTEHTHAYLRDEAVLAALAAL